MTYIGQTSTNFKKRLAVHKQTFKDTNLSQTALSTYIHELKSKGIEPKVTWKMIDRGKSFSPVPGMCHLCVKEAFYILFRQELAKINRFSEVFSACFHKKTTLVQLVPRFPKPNIFHS